MVCRMWKGRTLQADAAAYENYLRNELFPRLQNEPGKRGYRGSDILRKERGGETEFVTMVWFDSLDSVKGFAGEDYQTPVISEKARSLLSRRQTWCDHYELSGTQRAP